MSILSVDNISPIGSGTSVTINNAATLVLTNANIAGVTTASGGVRVNADGSTSANYISVGVNDDLKIYHHSAGVSQIYNSTGYLELYANAATWIKTTQFNIIDNDATHYHLRTFKDGAVELYHNNVKKLETTATSVTLSDNLVMGNHHIELNDNSQIMLGNAPDMRLYHDGSHSYITNTTGDLTIVDESRIKLRTDQFVVNNHANDESIIYAAANGEVSLYHNNVKKFDTTSSGVTVTGTCAATSFEATTFSKTPTNTPAFHAFRDGSFSPTFPNSTWTKITMLITETLDTDNAYDNSSSGTTANRFTVPSGKGGYYQVSAGLNFYADSNDLKSVILAIYKNGGKTMSAYGFISNYASGVRHFQCDIAGILNLSASDYLEVYAYFTTNGGVNNYISNDANGLRGNYFSAFKLII